MERGKARYAVVADGSNSPIKATPGTLYRAIWSKPEGGAIRIGSDIGASPNFNSPGAGMIFAGTAAGSDFTLDFGPGVGFESLDAAATSNARILVIYE